MSSRKRSPKNGSTVIDSAKQVVDRMKPVDIENLPKVGPFSLTWSVFDEMPNGERTLIVSRNVIIGRGPVPAESLQRAYQEAMHLLFPPGKPDEPQKVYRVRLTPIENPVEPIPEEMSHAKH